MRVPMPFRLVLGMAVVVGTVLTRVGMGVCFPSHVVRVGVFVLVSVNDLSTPVLMGMDVLEHFAKVITVWYAAFEAQPHPSLRPTS